MRRYLLTCCFVIIVALVNVALLARSSHVRSVQHPVSPHITEDDPRWNCETMGDHVCGTVNVETYREGTHTFVRVWDEHGRLVFGPSYVEGFER